MKKRELILAAGLGAVVVVIGGQWAYDSFIGAPIAARRAKAEDLQTKIDERKLELTRARVAARELNELRRVSLPSEVQIARSLYQAWLVELVGQLGLSNPNVDSGEAVDRKGLYRSITFSLRGRGTLEQWTRFLFAFYRAGHLHQIQSMAVTPLARQDELDVSITIEALILPEADREDRLSMVVSDRLASTNYDDYRPILKRNLFGVGGPGYDAASQAYLTAVLDVDGEPEAWFSLRATDEVLRLKHGAPFDIGEFRGMIAEIVDADVIIESEEERWLLTVGENLVQATTLPPEH